MSENGSISLIRTSMYFQLASACTGRRFRLKEVAGKN